MNNRLMKYNPAFLSSEELVKSFVVRLTDLELILETIRHNTGGSNQHILIIGPRGSGKTSLVLRTVAEVKKDAGLASKWHPIVFGEDSYEVCSPGEFWLEALFHLGEETKLSRWQKTYAELRSEPDEVRLRERALAQLMDLADEQGKRLLLVVENLNTILGQQINNEDDAWVLRHTLINEPRMMLLGTATSRFIEIENVGKAMYDLFKLHELKPLNTQDCRTMWTAITGEELSENRVRPIEILTGGNPRLLAIIANFAAKTSFRELMQDLTRLVDDHTEYFKSHLDGLPPLERKVFVALADLWDPLTARQVAEAARVDVNTASSLLKRLISRGAVEVFEERGRKNWYQVAERMYNIYHLMRRRGAPSSRIWAVVNFMIHFYESDHLAGITAAITAEACKPECSQRADHYTAYELLLQKIPSEELKEKILGSTPQQFFDMPDIPPNLRKSLVSMKRAPDLRGVGEAQDQEQKIFTPPESPEISRLIALGDELRGNRDQVQEAEQAYREAIRIDDNNADAWARLANFLHEETDRFDEAEAAYRKTLELKPDYVWAWGQLGQLLHEKVERYEEAESAYRKAIELKPDYAWAWFQLGQLLHEKLDRYGEAESAYRKVLELYPDYVWAWALLGILLHDKLNRFGESEAAYRKAIELNPDFADIWVKLGELLHEKVERYEEAELAYRKALELKPDIAWTWAHLGLLLNEELGRNEEAESAYRKALELEPDIGWGWAMLGMFLKEHGRYEEAKKAYLDALELDKNNYIIWELLIKLQMQQLGDSLSALSTMEGYLQSAQRSATGLINVACTVVEQQWEELYPQADTWMKEAVEKSPEDWPGYLRLASLQGARGNWHKALQNIAQYLTHTEILPAVIGRITDFFIEAAAAGHPAEALRTLKGTEWASHLEPLITGLKIFLGEKPSIAQEILEVGHDVAKRIEERKRQITKDIAKTKR
jgi:tetratricopeptide (TPR) repeat protein